MPVFRQGMRRLRIWALAGGAVAVAACAWAVAPALSLSPYLAEPVDFEQPLPRLRTAPQPVAQASGIRAKDHDAGRLYVSTPVRAPKRFDLVGVANQLGAVEYRVRELDRRWRAWVEVDSGDPVWAGGADYVQVRSHRRLRGARLHYVNVSGDSSPLNRLLNGARSAVNGALISVAATARADASPPRPRVVSRSAWGAKKCKPRATPVYGSVKAAAVHHTVTANDYSREDSAKIVLGICRFHRNANNWNDIGYNALVDRFGRIYVGRAGGLRQAVVGAHAQGYNAQTVGVAAIGTHSKVALPQAALRSMARFLAWKLWLHGSPGQGLVELISAGGKVNRYPNGELVELERIFGHRDVNKTECPGQALFENQLAALRAKVVARIGDSPFPTPPSPSAGQPSTGGQAPPAAQPPPAAAP
jgi:N-acetylmuramoyl-L-alanine amidase-like protein